MKKEYISGELKEELYKIVTQIMRYEKAMKKVDKLSWKKMGVMHINDIERKLYLQNQIKFDSCLSMIEILENDISRAVKALKVNKYKKQFEKIEGKISGIKVMIELDEGEEKFYRIVDNVFPS